VLRLELYVRTTATASIARQLSCMSKINTAWFALALGLLLNSCGAAQPAVDVARVSSGAFGSNGDDDVFAINLSSWALATPGRTKADPVDAARALAAVDYLAGELSYNPRWEYMSPITKNQMVQARLEVRQAIGVAPGASSQAVVVALLTYANALQTGDRAAADRALSTNIFTRSPDQITQTLAALPYLPIANVATQHASEQAEPNER
jgi:hypothetical protein